MAKKHTCFRRAAVLAAVSLLIGGCAHKLANSWPDDVTMTYWGIVETPGTSDTDLARLRAYYQALQDVAGTANLEEQFIGCIGCQQLSGSSPRPNKLKFIFFREHLDDMLAFTKAMKRVQGSPLRDLNFTLTYNTDPPPSHACPPPPPICSSIPSCVSTDGCDKYKLQSGCQLCVP